MWRLLKRKHADNSDEASDEMKRGHKTSDEEPQTPDQFHCIISSTTGRKEIRLDDASYLSIRFLRTGDPGCPVSLCVACGKRL